MLLSFGAKDSGWVERGVRSRHPDALCRSKQRDRRSSADDWRTTGPNRRRCISSSRRDKESLGWSTQPIHGWGWMRCAVWLKGYRAS